MKAVDVIIVASLPRQPENETRQPTSGFGFPGEFHTFKLDRKAQVDHSRHDSFFAIAWLLCYELRFSTFVEPNGMKYTIKSRVCPRSFMTSCGTQLMIAKIEPKKALNVLGGPLQTCSTDPMTGFLRDGCCNTNDQDFGSHTVCVKLTTEFLEFSKLAGNDLSTPMPEYGFPGLETGDRWCLCAARWQEAFEKKMAPLVVLESTHQRALEIVSLEAMREFAVDQ